MRGVRKGQPPTNIHPPRRERRPLQAAEHAFRADLGTQADPRAYARARFDELHKPALQDQLHQEQGGLCVYCEVRIRLDVDPGRVDHWTPISADPTLALHWKNLHLSCSSPSSCDQWKADKVLSPAAPLPWPCDFAYEDAIGYTGAGEAFARSHIRFETVPPALSEALGSAERGEEGLLNLNSPALCAARAAAVDGLRRELERDHLGRHLEREDRVAYVSRLLQTRPLPAFVSFKVAWLLRKLGA